MGCLASSAVKHDIVEQKISSEEVGEDAGELIRTVSEAIAPIRVSSRNLSPDDLVDQRARAKASFNGDGAVVRELSGFVALERNVSNRSFRRVGSRLSQMRPSVRQHFLNGIRDLHESGKGKSDSLEGRLKTFGMRMKEMEGDGNCQFRTLAFNLFGEQAHHAITRKAAVAHMKKHHDFFSVLFESADEFKAYLRDMARNRTWGDELTLRAVVEAYGVEAHVITSESANWYLVYQPEAGDAPDPKVAACPRGLERPKPGKQVFLSYISPVHYNSIVIAKSAEKE